MRKTNNHYLIITDGERYDELINESFGRYFIYETKKEALTSAPKEDVSHYKVKDFDVYIIVEPTTDGLTNKINNKIRLMKHLPKHFNGISKWDVEPIIKQIRNETNRM